jgi:signal transduction histidine kinase
MIAAQRNLSILTIDDDEDMRKSIVSYLEDMNFTVYQASGGRQGIEMFDRHHPDLVFTDLMMPEVDGLTVVSEIKRKSPETPVVVISGNGSVGYAIETVRKGAWDYITKPIHDFTVIERIADQVLDRANAMKAEKQRMESQQQDEKIEHLASGIAHDFKNILTGIVGNLSIAQNHLDDTHKASVSIKRAEVASQRANELAQKLMHLSRPDDAPQKAVMIKDAINECLTLILTGARVVGTVEIAEGLPNIHMDEGEFCQVLNNLFLNAVQAMPAGGNLSIIAESISLEQDKELSLIAGSYIRLEIKDSGSGISPDVLVKVFDPYFTTKPSGNGLGLASAKRLMDKNKGSIKVESIEGAGATVVLLIPAF